MRLALVVGVLVSALSFLIWILLGQALDSLGLFFSTYPNLRYFFPLLLCLLTGLFLQRRGKFSSVHSFATIFEAYHFGLSKGSFSFWMLWAFVSTGFFFLSGLFGVFGILLEASVALLALASRFFKLGSGTKKDQLLLSCVVAASFSAAFGTPVAGGLFAIELFRSLGARAQVASVLASLAAYGGIILFEGLSSGLSTDYYLTLAQHGLGFELISSLAHRLIIPDMSFSDWGRFLGMGIGVGVSGAVLFRLLEELAGRNRRLYLMLSDRVLAGNKALSVESQKVGTWAWCREMAPYLAVGLLLTVIAYGSQDLLRDPRALIPELTQMKLLPIVAVLLLLGRFAAVSVIWPAWSGAGLLSSFSALGALLGYISGMTFAPEWAGALSLTGGICLVAIGLNLHITAAVLAFELGVGGGLWWVILLSVFSTLGAARLLKSSSAIGIVLRWVGLRIVNGRVASVLRTISAKEAMYTDVESVTQGASVGDLRSAIARSKYNVLVVSASDSKYMGILELDRIPKRLRGVLLAPASKNDEISLSAHRAIDIGDLLDVHSQTIDPEASLAEAIELLINKSAIAVVDEHRIFRGILLESGVGERYRREMVLRSALTSE